MAGKQGIGEFEQLVLLVVPRDPLTLAAVVALAVGGSIAAASFPARYASRTDPIRVLGRD